MVGRRHGSSRNATDFDFGVDLAEHMNALVGEKQCHPLGQISLGVHPFLQLLLRPLEYSVDPPTRK